ncbi:transglutaminase family protein [Calditrichota bacterium GD2]
MRKVFINIFTIFFLFQLSLSQEPQPRYHGQTIYDIIKLPEEEIDIGLATLVLAKEFYPDMDVNYYLDIIDIIAIGVFALSQGSEDPLVRIATMNTFFYRKGEWNKYQPLEYDLDDLEARKLKNRFLNGYLDTKQGSCITMPMLHIVVGQRLKWPIYAVGSPKHFFCRYLEQGFPESNIEATSGGGYIPDSSYIIDTGIPENALRNGVYLRNLRNKEYIGRLISINASVYFEKGNIDKAIEYLKLSKQLDPTFSGAFWNLGFMYYVKAKKLEQQMKNEIEMEQFLSDQRMKKQPDQYVTKINTNNNILDQFDLEPKPFTFGKYPSIKQKEIVKPIVPQVGNRNRKKVDQNLQIYIEAIYATYIPKIERYYKLSKENRREAERLGIVLKFPEQFFLKQSKSILKFKEKGEY